jgi:hypothetical protein
MSGADVTCWAQDLGAVMERIGARFGRLEPRRRAIARPIGYRIFYRGRTGRPIGCPPRRNNIVRAGSRSQPAAIEANRKPQSPHLYVTCP